jgi:tetratricopeptide (TPR) repeat protein
MLDAPRLSVAILARDEEPTIGRAIDSASGVAFEVVVLDTGSEDRTVEIAKAKGARVIHCAWESNFASARNRLIDACLGDWVLMLDADEAISPEFRERWSTLDRSADGFVIPVRDMDQGVVRQHARAARLFRRDPRYRYEGRIHEEISPSIVSAGGTVAEATLPIVHYGYTSSEDMRKGRRGRNLALLLAEHEARPNDARILHYLGLEHLAAGELAKAQPLFERVLLEQPEAPFAGWTASLLAEVHLREGRPGAAWGAAHFGVQRAEGRVMSLVRMGTLALDDGDPATALECADGLDQVSAGAHGDIPRRAAIAVELRAGALAEWGQRREALDVLASGARSHPNDASLADQLVRLSEEVHGSMAGALQAVRLAGTPFVMAATVGAVVRHEEWDRAIALAERIAAASIYRAHALLRVGRTEEGVSLLEKLGAEGRRHLLLHGLEVRDRDLVDRATTLEPAAARATAFALFDGVAMGHERAHFVWPWVRYWLEYRGRELAIRLAYATGSPGVAGRLATCFYRAGLAREALVIAGAAPRDPGSLEVGALDAHARGNTPAVAQLCVDRAALGDAPVRIYRLGAEALVRLARPAEAASLLRVGKRERPFARLG